MPYFNIVAATSENTVVTEYEPVIARSDSYQSEAALEKEFIRLLCEQGYTYLPIHSEDDLIRNLRSELERLNNYQFSDDEWERFFKESIANANEHIEEKTCKIQEDNVQVLKRDDGSTKNITLIDRKNIHSNSLQVINQYEVSQDDGARHNNRYDVTVLVNGLPLVHIELKRRGIPIREAFNQINRYQRDSFWSGCGLYEYVQIFVISNGTNTKYYSNSTRFNAIKDSKSRSGQKEKTSNSFEFTSYWADANNKVIPDLIDFTKTFFAKHTILNILTKYCVFTAEKMLMVMRPYQITATERILNRIEISNNYKKYGTIAGGGFIWHTTGSGKTLTSFKAARLASQLSYIDKVLFVVDRKDLDYQTMKEYDRFEKGAANSNTSSAILERQLRDPNAKIIITTIQKLSAFIKKFKTHEAYGQHVVIIFDESQHSGAESYRKIMAYFQPDFWLGMTATPETNRFDVYEIFDHNIAYEIRLKQALEEDLLCPFHYFGITDIEIDGEVIGDEDDAENFRAFVRLTCDERVDYVISQAEYYGHCGDRVIPGISTIHFDEISRKRIFAAIDSSNFNDVRLIRENYTNLKFKLGRIPKLKDFDDYGEMDVCRIFDNASLGSYYKFLVKYEKEYHIRLSAAEEKMVEFISKKLASGKRIQELELLKRLLVYKHGIFHDLRQSLQENYDISLDENADENLVNMMTNEFPTSAAKKTYETCIFIRKEGADYGISPSFEKMLENPDFYDIVKELIDFGISRYQANFSERYQNTDFVLYQKYTYEDVCRLLNWESNEVPLNIGGYKFDRKTRTLPVFINYDKAEDISDTTKYEDHFVDSGTLIAISKSGRSIDSEDVQNFLHARERGIDVHLLVRKNKDDKISKEFYYLGRMYATGQKQEFQMPNTTRTAVEIEWKLDTPVREDIYQYIIG